MADLTTQQAADFAFLALCVWREARSESSEAKLAVAYVAIQRVKLQSWMGKNMMEVLFHPWQFSSLTNPRDPQLTRWPREDDDSWHDCLFQTALAIDGSAQNPAPGADSYYGISIEPPAWAAQGQFIKQIGQLRFFRTAGGPT